MSSFGRLANPEHADIACESEGIFVGYRVWIRYPNQLAADRGACLTILSFNASFPNLGKLDGINGRHEIDLIRWKSELVTRLCVVRDSVSADDDDLSSAGIEESQQRERRTAVAARVSLKKFSRGVAYPTL